MKKTIAFFTLFTLFTPYFHLFGAFNESSVQSYLEQNAENPWSTMALAALDADSIPTAYLKSANPTTAIAAAAPLLAITAIGGDPRIFGDTDLVAKLKSFFDGAQIGDTSTLNDDIFGILALRSAGVASSDDTVSKTKDFLLAKQNTDGGWGFVADSASDTNMTAVGILALLQAGLPSSGSAVQEALSYLQTAQNEDGGFPYDPQSSFGADSDSASTAWVVWALNALSINPASWTKSAGNPISYLDSLQNETGYVGFQSADEQATSFSVVTTAYAVIALSGKTLPLQLSQPEPNIFQFKIEGSSGTICENSIEAVNAFDVVKNSSEECGFTYVIEETDFGPYLSQINDDRAEGLTGWMYFVNLSAPSVGAADYTLSPGDQILWKFAEFGWTPDSVSVNLNLIYDSGSVGGIDKGSETDTIAFSVSPNDLDFGVLTAGSKGQGTVNIANTGGVNIYLESIVSGDKMFRDLLKIEGTYWQQFETQLASSANRDYDVTIDIPQNYAASSGVKQGQITFWATAE
ncbi:MAG: hypothetical protein COT91_00655 [Candidatus Doudnabacteria bacterium CG10_big_fil_rev_8_21_14_0_10_41_10]|uniref:Uncharacterized protein n=1 Tax=Candidatus Doudnabacteria bacterium CG10_big_fil_rev_8_21_14_0_10_41_10 TaxID=1974551 RepID=A0A2H0VEP3_9BACT|nr:MAG: hypothetical protein COT91_00655 [Candidatus Doudnabacteria bacterium CG10_big_fil_rev_8_21_14_0_10_41_10]